MATIYEHIAELVRAISPYDSLEGEHQTDVLSWLRATEDIYRRAKPDVPPKHLVSYFVMLDESTNSVLLVDHIKSGLWLPAGGHVEHGEDPWAAVTRECTEELFIDARAIPRFGTRPVFVTVTQTRGRGMHTDVSLWYVLAAAPAEITEYDSDEFRSIRWVSLSDVMTADGSTMDPHMQRVASKIQAQDL